MRLKLDLHIHSVYSPDSFNTVDIINTRIREMDFDGYSLADHDTMAGLKEAEEKKGDLVFVPALEVSAKNVHIIALDPTEPISQDLGMTETVELIHDQGATAVLAHPYGFPRSWVSIDQVEEAGFNAIEVANSAQFPYQYICGLNQRLADRLNLPVTGGSDSHIPETIGRSYTIVESDSAELDDVIKAIKRGETSVGGSHTRISEWFRKNIKKKE